MVIETVISRYMRHSAQRILSLNLKSPCEAPQSDPGTERLLYIHIPFCETLCSFCTFHRVRFNENLAARYFKALRLEIRRYYDQGFRFNDAYFGGGTPTVSPDELTKTLDLMRSYGFRGQISVETNPDHLRPQITDQLLDAGVDRLSVGVQSFDDVLLKEMGRYERYGSGNEIATRLEQLQGTFRTLNIDLIFNFPHQSLSSLRQDIALLHKLELDQVSYYPLMPATQTRRAMAKEMGEVNFSREKMMYREILQGMTPAYAASSAWCFVRGEAMIDEYIVEHEEYLGVGSGSFSYIGGTLYSSSFSIQRYIDRVTRGHTGVVMHRALQAREQQRYHLLMGLFGLTMPFDKLSSTDGRIAEHSLWKELLLFRAIGAVRRESDGYRLTSRGMYLWVLMMREFLMGVNQFRAEMRHHIRHEQQTRLQETAIPVESLTKQGA